MQFPTVLEINTRVWLSERGLAGVNDIPDEQLAHWAGQGFTMIWLMGVWAPSPRARQIGFEMRGLLTDCERVLPGSIPDAVVASPYAIYAYRLSARLGRPEDLAALRQRLHGHGMGLMLDFVPNHQAVDHPDVQKYPERFVHGSATDVLQAPQNWFAIEGERARVHLLAHGRDPYFDGWSDTVQVNYFHPEARRSMQEQLASVAAQCDGVRCDMAMLITNDVMMRTWGERLLSDGGTHPGAEFWAQAIPAIKAIQPDFVFLAEVYWGMEPALQAMGFDYTYDKALYDALRERHADSVRGALLRPGADRQARFLENHDETRAAATFDGFHAAAAALTFTLPGLRLLYEGQLDGRRIEAPVQLSARPQEPLDEGIMSLYDRLLPALRAPVFHQPGEWRLENTGAAGDDSHAQAVALSLSGANARWLVIANLAPYRIQGFVPTSGPVFRDVLSQETYVRDTAELAERGLYFALEAGQAHMFEVTAGG